MLVRIGLTAAGALVAAGTCWGQWIVTEEAKLTASDAASDDYFGISVALSGDTAVVGAEGDDNFIGSAYVFVQSAMGWNEQQKLIASDATQKDSFGWSVAVSGDTALVGAPLDNHDGSNDAGSAYVFVRSGATWSEQAKLVASDAMPGDRFGYSVALSGDTALIGASLDDHGGIIDAGSAYVFVRRGTMWNEQQVLTADGVAPGAEFGSSVALSGETAVVGAPFDWQAGIFFAGSAYVFVQRGTSWKEEAKLTADDGARSDWLGCSVAVSGDTAMVGAVVDDNSGGYQAGSAHVFVRNGASWSRQAMLIASDAEEYDSFGNAVAVWGDTALIGAALNDNPGTDRGSAYLFARSGTSWSEQQEFIGSDSAKFDYFGQSVALSGDIALVGALGDNHSGAADAGSAYVFRLSPGAPVTFCTAGTSASGCQATLWAAGIASASAASGFDLMAATVAGAQEGGFFLGVNGRQAKPWGNGTSFICVAPPITRLRTLGGTGTQGQCDGSFTQDLNAVWCPSCPRPGLNPGYGVMVQVQLWYRDPLDASNQTTSLSDAIEFAVGP